MSIRWLPAALRDLEEISEFVAADSSAAAADLAERIEAAVSRLADFPEMGRSGRVTGTRELVIRGSPYIVPYRVNEDAVEILAVRHAARQRPGRF